MAVKTKQVEGVAEALGEQAEAMALAERQGALAGKIVVLKSVPKRYVAVEGSTPYAGAIERVGPFGWRIYAEAVRRGRSRAERVMVLGDGAPWIWGMAEEHFPGALQIVDLYPAREHLANLGKILDGPAGLETKRWVAARYEELGGGKVEAVVTALRRLRPRNP